MGVIRLSQASHPGNENFDTPYACHPSLPRTVREVLYVQLTEAIPVRRHDMAQAFFFKTLSTKKFITLDRSSASAVFSAI